MGIFIHQVAKSIINFAHIDLIIFFGCGLISYRYVDVILQLIDKAGDFVSDDIWFRVVQFVTNNEDLQVRML